MSVVRSVLFWALFGALAGTWAGGVFARYWLPWYNSPNAGIMSQCACRPLAESTVTSTLMHQAIGMAIGAVSFVVLAVVLGAGKKKAAPPPATA